MSSAQSIADFIKSHDNFLIASHVFPDGDSVGCVASLIEALGQLGKNYSAFIRGQLPRIFEWMPYADRINSELDNALRMLEWNPDGKSPALLIVDAGDIHRMGDGFAKWFETKKNIEIANIDHHQTNVNFGTINWIDAGYASVGEMLYEIFKILNIKITPSIAQNLFVSVYTDTGRFSFGNTTERSFRYAADFVSLGANPREAFSGVYANRTLESFRLQTESFKTLSKFLDGKACYFWVDQAMLAHTGTTMEDTEGFIDAVRLLRDFDMVVFFKEIDRTDVRVSVRAAPPIDASVITGLFGGGGHPRAAGCRFTVPLPDAIRTFVETAERVIRSGGAAERKS